MGSTLPQTWLLCVIYPCQSNFIIYFKWDSVQWNISSYNYLTTDVLHHAMWTTVVDNQSLPVLRPWVFLFGTWQECFQRLGNAGKPELKRLARADQPKTQYLPFLAPEFWQCHKQLAKNTEKCAIDSFFKAEDDPTQIEQFLQAVRQIYSL